MIRSTSVFFSLVLTGLLAACGAANDQSSLAASTDPRDGLVAVSTDGSGLYNATLTGDQVAALRAGLTADRYTSLNGGLKIDCKSDAACIIVVDTRRGDLSNIHRPSDEGNKELLQVWLEGDIGKDFYLNQAAKPERFVSNDLGLETYNKDVLKADANFGPSASIDCFMKVIPHLVFFHKTSFACVVELNGYSGE